ncbi:MAG: hypothetical protein AAFQ80_11915 [Cyanobacteria bacterium J06621_8]
MRLTKLANWFSDGDLEKYQQQAQHVQEITSELQRLKPKLEKLELDYQQSQKELVQTQAQLQIYQGFQIELGETQQKLQQTEAQVQRYKQELLEQQQQFNARQSQLKQTQQALDELSQSQDWAHQIKIPIQIADIKKTLPKADFETLWGFGIITPSVATEIVTGAMLVKGWVLGKKSSAQKVRLIHQGENLLETLVSLRSPLVVQQYPDIPAANQSGFEFTLAVTGIYAQIELNLEAVLSDETVVPLCNFILKSPTIESKDT